MGRIAEALKKAESEKIKIEQYRDERRYVAKRVSTDGIDPHVIFYFDPKSSIAEQYRALRTNLLSLREDKPFESIMFASAVGGEGKTISLLNLAVSLATELDKKVLLVDANLKKPELHQMLDVESRHGLSDYLNNGLALKDIVSETNINNVSLIVGGGYCTNSVELLDSQKMKDLIEEASGKYDFVFYDVPDVISYTDASVLGPKLDGAIMNIELERTDRKVIDRAIGQLIESRVNIIGTILTKAKYPIPELVYKYL